MAERLRCDNCIGIIREECDRGFKKEVARQLTHDVIGKFAVDETSSQPYVSTLLSRRRNNSLRLLIEDQRAFNCNLTDDQIQNAVHIEEQAMRSGNPENIQEFEQRMTTAFANFVKDIKD